MMVIELRLQADTLAIIEWMNRKESFSFDIILRPLIFTY